MRKRFANLGSLSSWGSISPLLAVAFLLSGGGAFPLMAREPVAKRPAGAKTAATTAAQRLRANRQQMWAPFDLNHDGRLSPEERFAFREAKRNGLLNAGANFAGIGVPNIGAARAGWGGAFNNVGGVGQLANGLMPGMAANGGQIISPFQGSGMQAIGALESRGLQDLGVLESQGLQALGAIEGQGLQEIGALEGQGIHALGDLIHGLGGHLATYISNVALGLGRDCERRNFHRDRVADRSDP